MKLVKLHKYILDFYSIVPLFYFLIKNQIINIFYSKYLKLSPNYELLISNDKKLYAYNTSNTKWWLIFWILKNNNE